MLTFADASRQVRIASIAYSETLRIIALIRKTTPTLSQLKLINGQDVRQGRLAGETIPFVALQTIA